MRSSTRFISWKDCKRGCTDLWKIYTAPNIEAAEAALEDFEEVWGDQYPMVGQAWRKQWDEIHHS